MCAKRQMLPMKPPKEFLEQISKENSMYNYDSNPHKDKEISENEENWIDYIVNNAEGRVTKKDTSSVKTDYAQGSSWRPRYFMLEPGCLKYSLEKNGLVKESFILSHCTIRLIPDDPVRLDIDIVGRGLLCLRTDTPSDKHKWYISFKRAQKLLFQAYQRKVLTSSGVYSIEGTPAVPYKGTESNLSQKISTLNIDDENAIFDELLDNQEGEQVPISELFIKTKVGHDPKTALACLLENTTCFQELCNTIIADILQDSSVDPKSKVKTVSLLIKEFCSATQALYLEEQRSRQELEQSLFKMTRRNMKLERENDAETSSNGQVLNDDAAVDEDDHMHVSSKMIDVVDSDSETSFSAYDINQENEFFECEDTVRPSKSETAKSTEVTKKDELTARSEEERLNVPYTSQSIVRRTKLPRPRTELNVSIWSILKDLIGKDLSRISMPICLNEPTTTLQRTCEDFQYSEILNEACKFETSLERMARVTIFSITPYESAVGRTYKPFNPLLGETFELTHRGFNFIAEQVGHHPPISAFHCSNEYFDAYGSTHITVKLTGKCVEASILGPFVIDLKLNSGIEKYILQRCYVVVHNIIFGKMWIETVGTAIIRNATSGEFSVVQYLRKGWFDKEIHKVRGLVFDRYGGAHYYLCGKWSEEIYMQKLHVGKRSDKPMLLDDGTLDYQRYLYKSEDEAWDSFVNEIDWNQLDIIPNTKTMVWKPHARPPVHEDYYGFGYITLELNDITPEYDPTKGAQIARTDSRFRPDRKAYEDGDMDVASKEKHRLEEKQRFAAQKRVGGEASYKPLWFDKSIDPETGNPLWTFKGTYWKAKADGTINDHTPDIF
ncbi:bifunctional Pleckstrin homology domain/PH-like domain superfamily/Oxysterol-binding protein/Oxysterol-binding protein superfamily [Babesia duncani]|uniref:Bifunctional Pleckstrin homology domain/PH-like domain superfamily/Oxysterol-binding protein/Oxysterol-binding protein superfamily n=1 Tax=Babesia duncani TaxID=323732 RepID=A0AAD9PLC8_9APIC|nr:bifunctional Pleckstrin homology domain/PH-like domain superfamily/Oxysterol-binding protein/Oxysterol-binding protein superfamily [Babesia duncani]